ncbi:cation diffusion facilitator family transporter [Corynebacterium sp. Marseille-P3884]|uniref:cation diffusion facilitator family transporter n=1 Tax=Corynebacterium sp. Marseille-P3884 TaxID=2495409 RepID=UPI001B341864|nr:cation diffusion facilitator family transporter [Corynebacterium sp. Marseille-P3884]MBP3947653.1 cation transporter [Corynebacterium sp. Marseille-P3884]
MTEHSHGHGHGHDHGHSHSHDHNASDAPLWALGTALAITGVVFFAELIGGWLSGSMALMADAMHMLSDATGLIIALVAVAVGRKPVSRYATFGYRRAEVLAAAFNAVMVAAISVWIVVEAVQRIGSPEEVQTRAMIIVAVVGLIANVVSALVLQSQREHSVNIEGAFLHVMVDLLGSVAVIAAGVVIAVTGFTGADVVASLIIAGLVLPRAWGLLKASISVLLERVPAGIDPVNVGNALVALDGVDAIHDLHLWSAGGRDVLCTVHLITRADHGQLLDRAQGRLRELGIEHATIQIEGPGHFEHEVYCAPHGDRE